MTDLPRRSYPLVVPPPGGFEDAVRRGRNVRRKRVGGSSAIALVLVGALGWSVLGGGSDVTRLDQANETEATPSPRTLPQVGNPYVPPPTAAPTVPVDGPRPTSTPVSGNDVRPSADPGRPVGVTPRNPSARPPGARFATRNAIDRTGPTAGADCLGTTSPSQQWCARAFANETGEFQYELTYTLCRSHTAPAGPVTFDWYQEVDFAATDKAHNDTVWTYSKGVRKVEDYESLTVERGFCYTWTTVWDGFDDYGYTPPAGTYVLTARPLARETDLPAAQIEFMHR